MILIDDNRSIISVIQFDMETISNLYKSNMLNLNLSKSKYILLGNRDLHPDVMNLMNEMSIAATSVLTYLGIPIDDQLTFSSLGEQIRRKLSQSIGATYILKNRLTTDLLISFYYGHFQVHLNDCAFLLLRSPTQMLKNLQTLQNRCLKIIFGLPYDYSTRDLFINIALTILPVMGLLFYSCLIMVKKSLLFDDPALVHFDELKSQRLKKSR